MKILWFSHLVPYPATGRGVLQRSYHLVRELARIHEVHLLAFIQRRIFVDLRGEVEEEIEKARRHLEQYCARVRFLSIPCESGRWGRARLAGYSLLGQHPYTIKWLQSGEAWKVASEWNAETRFDIAHLDTISLAPYRKVFTHSAMTLDHHNIESHMMLRRARLEKQPLKRLYFWQEGARLERYERRVCPEFDLNITCSDLDTGRLRAIVPGARIAEVPNGVDTNYFRPDEKVERPNSLVFAGGMSQYANASAMLFFADRVWPILKQKLPGVTIDVLGGNPPRRLRALAARDKDFRVRGFVADVRPFVGQAAAYVCPIMDGGGTKLKVLDALAMGKPVVAHPTACEGINVQEAHNVVFAREPDEFVREIVALLADSERRMYLSRNARQLAESSYSYSSIGAKLVATLERCRAERDESHLIHAPGDEVDWSGARSRSMS